MTGIAPTSIAFMHNNKPTGKYLLTESHPGSLDDESYFTTGNPTMALIVGPLDAQCGLFDNREYDLSENALMIFLKRAGTADHPIEVDCIFDRLGTGDHRNGTYSGEVESFGWILHKQAKADWVERSLTFAGKFADVLDEIAKAVPGAGKWEQYINIGGVVVKKLAAAVDRPGSSNNSHVDNISSVLFGSAPDA